MILKVWYGYMAGEVEICKCNRTESPDIDLNTYRSLAYEKYGILSQWGKDAIFNTL